MCISVSTLVPSLCLLPFFSSAPSFSLSLSFCSSLSASALPLFLSAPLLWLLQLVAMATEGLSSFRQQWSGARGCHHPTLFPSFSVSPCPLLLSIQLSVPISPIPVTHPDLFFLFVTAFSCYQHHCCIWDKGQHKQQLAQFTASLL